MSLENRALLIKVSKHTVTFSVTDKQATRETAEHHNSDITMGKYIKNIIPKEKLEHLRKTINRVTPFVNTYTSPWLDGGWRLLPVELYERVEKGLRDINQEIEIALDNFCSNYEMSKEVAKNRLGSLFNPSEYPSTDEVRSKFGIDVFFNPIPTKDDIRIEASKEQIEEIKKRVEENSEKSLKSAMKHTWDRVFQALERLKERMSAEITINSKGEEIKPRLFDSILGDIRELVELLPYLNIDNDPKLEDVRRKMEKEFAELSMETLREDGDMRKEVANKAEAIIDNIKGIM